MRLIKILLLLCLVHATFSCCSPDMETEAVDAGTLYAPYNTSVDMEAKGGTATSPIYCKGSWKISSQDSWIGVKDETGEDNGTLVLQVAHNNGAAKRTGSVKVALALDTLVHYMFRVNQKPSTSLFTDTGYDKGAGYGYKVCDDYPLGATFAIFNVGVLDSLQHDSIGLYFVEDDQSQYSAEENYYGNTTESISRQLSANASIDLASVYGSFSVSGSVSKSSLEKKNSEYAIKRTKRVLYARDIQYMNVIRYYQDTGDSSVFAPGFFADYSELEKYNDTDNLPSSAKVNSFLDKWGIGFIARAFYGGSVDYSMQVDKSVLTDMFTVSMALDAKVAGGLIKVDGNVGYEEDLQKLKEKYSLDIYIHGGDVKQISALVFGESISVTDMQNWVDSLQYSDDKNKNNAVLMDVKIASIANLFTGKVAKRVQDIIGLRDE